MSIQPSNPLSRVDPQDTIVPLFGLNGRKEIEAFLGTASFIRDGAVLLTADHVIRDWSGPIGAFVRSKQEMLSLEVLDRDPAHDLALLQTVTEHHPEWVPQIPPNCEPTIYWDVPVLAMEYGTTRADLPRGVAVHAATRMGNITRAFTSLDVLGPAGDGALELSFPALRGASGAPVFYNTLHFGTVVGVIVANQSYRLLPAQIESVLYADNSALEETRYLLPQGIAVNIQHLKPMWDKLEASQ